MFGFNIFADINEICLHFPLFPFSTKYGVAVFSPAKSTFSLTSDPYVVSDIFLLPENRWFLRYYQKKRVVYIYLSGWWDSNPHAFRHQILSLTRLPIPPHPVKKHSNDFRSHVCQFPDGFIAPTARETRTLSIFLHLGFKPFYETIL